MYSTLIILLNVKFPQQHDCFLAKQPSINWIGLINAGTGEIDQPYGIFVLHLIHTLNELIGLHQYRRSDHWNTRSRRLLSHIDVELRHT